MLSVESFVASGNIAPMRFVAMSPGADYKVVQAVAADNPIGISGTFTETFDGSNHATAGHTCRVYGIGETPLLELGGTVSAGDYIGPDASGKGVAVSLTATAHDDIGAWALRNGLSGHFIPVKVVKFSGPMA